MKKGYLVDCLQSLKIGLEPVPIMIGEVKSDNPNHQASLICSRQAVKSVIEDIDDLIKEIER